MIRDEIASALFLASTPFFITSLVLMRRKRPRDALLALIMVYVLADLACMVWRMWPGVAVATGMMIYLIDVWRKGKPPRKRRRRKARRFVPVRRTAPVGA